MKSNKLKTVLTGVSAFALMSMAAAPLIAGADTTSYSTSGAFGNMQGSNESGVYLYVNASEFAERAGSTKIAGSGAYVWGVNYVSGCWFGFGWTDPDTTTIQFKATGAQPSQVTATGSVAVTWTDSCDPSGVPTSFTETVTFNMDLSAVTSLTASHFGTTQDTYQDQYYATRVKVNIHFDTSDAPATANASSISSPRFGTVTLTSGSVGKGKSSEVVVR